LDIQVGEHAVDYAHIAQKEKLSELQLRVRQLLDQVEQITKEQNYQRVRRNRRFSFLLSEAQLKNAIITPHPTDPTPPPNLKRLSAPRTQFTLFSYNFIACTRPQLFFSHNFFTQFFQISPLVSKLYNF
jgi:hypothetical protein